MAALLGYRVFPGSAGAARLTDALNAADVAANGSTSTVTVWRNGVQTGERMVPRFSVTQAVAEEGGSRQAVPISGAADSFHGVSVNLPEQSPADVVIDTRTDVGPLPSDWGT